jgi:signal transduction histidine kinase
MVYQTLNMTIYDINNNLTPGRHGLTRQVSLLRLMGAWGCQSAITLFTALVLLAVLWTGVAAAPLPPQAQVSSVNLEPHAALLVDKNGTLSIEEVAHPNQASGFKPLTGPLSLGFTRAVVWVKIDVTAMESSLWLLELGQPILEDVRLYQRQPDGQFQVRQGTHNHAHPPQETDYRRPVFQIHLTANEPTTLYLRLATRTSMVTTLKLWSPMALFEDSNLETFIWGLVFGSYCLVVFFYSAFWLWTREKVHLYYVMYVTTNLGAAFLTGRWNDMLGLDIDSNTHTLALGVAVCLSLWIAPVFTNAYLGTHRIWPRASRVFLHACAGISVAGVILVLAGQYSLGVLSVQVTSIFVIFLNLTVCGYLAYKGDKKGQLLLMAFGLFYIGVMWRYLRNIGVIEPSAWNESVYQIGAFVHMMVMSTGIFSSYNALRRKSEHERARANAQEKQRERQYEFLGMVSHEVRTPLTVISASADNMLMDPALTINAKNRASKIIRHSQKLQTLFDTYLNNERLLNGDNAMQMSNVNLLSLCESLVQDMKDAHGIEVRFDTPVQLHLTCDADLLRVAISNLLENARKHAPNNANITLSLSQRDGMARITVTDEGPGVDDQDMPYIFDAYFRGQGAYTSVGSGLGLHLVQFIAKQHQGRVHAQKLKPHGMQFEIEIPLQPPQASSASSV